MMVFLHAVLLIVLSTFSPASVISLLRAVIHLMFGRSLLLFPGMSISSILLTMCSSFILITRPYHSSSFLCNVLGRLRQSCCTSNMLISDRITYSSSSPIRFLIICVSRLGWWLFFLFKFRIVIVLFNSHNNLVYLETTSSRVLPLVSLV